MHSWNKIWKYDEHSGLDGQFFIVIDIEAFIDLNEYEKKIKLIIKEFKSSRFLQKKRIYLVKWK